MAKYFAVKKNNPILIFFSWDEMSISNVNFGVNFDRK